MANHVPRQSCHHKKPLPAHSKPTKSAPVSKRTNSNGSSKKVVQKEVDLEEEDLMAESFLQYCTTCEKQIIVPKNSVLYCSESCRKRDTERQLVYPEEYSPPSTPYGSYLNLSSEEVRYRDIVAPRSPTTCWSKRSSWNFSDGSSDENIASGDERLRDTSRRSCPRPRQYHYPTHSIDTNPTTSSQRSRQYRAVAYQASNSGAPSLSHTPVSSVPYSLPYTPSNRPLPPRTKPHASSYSSKSVDLVTPWTYASTDLPPPSPQYSFKTRPISTMSTNLVEGEIMYAKSPVTSMSPANGSLGRLLASTPR